MKEPNYSFFKKKIEGSNPNFLDSRDQNKSSLNFKSEKYNLPINIYV